MFLQFDIGAVNLFFITPAELHVKFRRATIFIGFQPGNLMMFESFLLGEINQPATYTSAFIFRENKGRKKTAFIRQNY